MRTKPALLILATLLLLLSPGCVEPVEITPPQSQEVVVNCLLSEYPVQRLSLSYSGDFADPSYREVEEAEVTLYRDSVEVGKFEKVGYDTWELEYTTKPGSRYDLRVEVPGRPVVTATTVAPYRPKITPVRVLDEGGRRYFSKDNETQIFWIFALYTPDGSAPMPPYDWDSYRLKESLA